MTNARFARAITATIAAAVLVTLAPTAAGATTPPTPAFASASVDPYGAYPIYACDTADPRRAGAEGLRSMVLAAYPASWSGELWSPCNSPKHISTSLHHAGRAWDWFVAARETAPSRPNGPWATNWSAG